MTRAESRWSWRRRPARRGDDGAVLVEFAFLALPLFLILFGIIEFGWGFYQQLDVRHGAREGSRLVAVNYQTTASPTPTEQKNQLLAEACSRMDSGDNVSMQFELQTGADIGDEFTVRVTKPLDQLTGFLGFALDGATLTSEVDGRLEQEATWQSMGSTEPCP